MKWTTKAFTNVGECLWRNNLTGTYYAFIKHRGKQFRRSLKTCDRQLAERRLAALRAKVAALTDAKNAGKITFAVLADDWLQTVVGNMKESSAERRKLSVEKLKPFFLSAAA